MVQSLTPFHHAGRAGESPLEGVTGLDTVRDCAVRVGFEAGFVQSVVEIVNGLFTGRLWHYQPIDVRYHDLAHTAQASRCFLALVEGYLRTEAPPALPREFVVGLAAILFHDTGFLKALGDNQGTGAKYTHSHVLRSSALAASLLPTLGFGPVEVEDAVGMIRCTGLTGKPDKSHFSSDLARTTACMVATADYLGQMAAPDYLEKLPFLFAEFEEADNYNHVPRAKRLFKSAEELLAGTPGFWRGFVRPRLEKDFAGVHRYLALPPPARKNPYLDAVERNVSLSAGAT
jgi:hypothetical protein